MEGHCMDGLLHKGKTHDRSEGGIVLSCVSPL